MTEPRNEPPASAPRETQKLADPDVAFILERLRQSGREKDEPVLALAAALVVAEAEVERLREALRRIAEEPCPHPGPTVPMCPYCAEDAREALALGMRTTGGPT
jgi:hypothetical protein